MKKFIFVFLMLLLNFVNIKAEFPLFDNGSLDSKTYHFVEVNDTLLIPSLFGKVTAVNKQDGSIVYEKELGNTIFMMKKVKNSIYCSISKDNVIQLVKYDESFNNEESLFISPTFTALDILEISSDSMYVVGINTGSTHKGACLYTYDKFNNYVLEEIADSKMAIGVNRNSNGDIFIQDINGKVYKKTYFEDAGETLIDLFDDDSKRIRTSLIYVDDLYSVGDSGMIAVLKNGETNWKIYDNAYFPNLYINDIEFVNKNVFYIAGYEPATGKGSVYFTQNNGEYWELILEKNDNLAFLKKEYDFLYVASNKGSIWIESIVGNVLEASKGELSVNYDKRSNQLIINSKELLNGKISVALYNYQGIMLYENPDVSYEENELILNLPDALSKSIYFVRISKGTNVYSSKFYVE